MMKSITTRLIALLTGCAALIVGGGMWLDYHLSRQEILQGLETRATDEVQVVVGDLENWLNGVEGATRFLGTILSQRQYSPEGLRQMLRDIVEHNSEIFGAAIALNPELTDSPQGFAPYYFRRDGSIQFADLASEQANYQEQRWFTEPARTGKGIWIEPYFDAGGGEVNMTTFSVPVFHLNDAGERELYAVVTADVKLKDLQRLLEQLHLGENSYSLLFSREGILMSTRSQQHVMSHYSDLTNKGVEVEQWREMFQLALQGQVISRQVSCPEVDSHCIIRMGSLRSTGWPIAVVVDRREVLAPLYNYQLKAVLISSSTLLLMALAVYIVTSRQTRPLKELTRATEGLARGLMDSPLPTPRGDDEVARLVRSFTSMNRDLKTYISDLESATASRSRLEGELAAARDIQMSMLPGSGKALIEEDGVALWARVEPAKSVGGDLYTFYRSGDLLFIAVGDVSDKGVPAALFMARAISLIQQLFGTAAGPAEAMAEINDALERDNHNCMFVTLFLGVLDIANGQLRFASAGHTAPSLLRDNAVTEVAQETGPALGLATGQNYPLNTLQLQGADRLAIFTDGIDEAFNEAAEMFGLERFNLALAENAGLSLPETGAKLFCAVEQHAGGQPQSDDITLLLLQYTAEVPAADQGFDLGEGLTGRIHSWMKPLLDMWEVDPGVQMEIELIAEEVATNVMKYSGLEANDTLNLSLSHNQQLLVLEVRDAGQPFDPLRQANRSVLGADIESAEIGGLGVHLLTQLSDRQSYRWDGRCNILRIEKDLDTHNA
jgi:phosphoserine phosphatase RsbU/P